MVTHSNDRPHSLLATLETTTDPLLAQCNGSPLVHQAGTSNGQALQLLFRHLNHNHRAWISDFPLRTTIATGGNTDLDLLHMPSVAATRLGRLATTALLQRLLRKGRHQAVLLLPRQDLDRDHLLGPALKFLVGNQSP